MFNYWTALAVFVSYLVLDSLYVFYLRAATNKRAVQAACVGSVMYAIAAYGVVSYSDKWRYVFPLIAGAWIGTFVTVRWTGKLEPK